MTIWIPFFFSKQIPSHVLHANSDMCITIKINVLTYVPSCTNPVILAIREVYERSTDKHGTYARHTSAH